ncbi:hypothetical protein FIBSPDRAFT_66010 [Athelia psychrophila]|uniref:EF-hand domain-containing protein n=1 Tax=Athelia psychrophila TaxID=1759441 RepID=A0A166ESG3_9AGAM|nr:hypothetical protein FIBSPDRAFT_66010 [Fibularhizoctonia sp. CBS 109695]
MHSGNDETAKAVKEAESVVAGSTKATSKRTEKLDKIEDRLIEPTESGYYSTATDFYAQNEAGIKSAASDIAKSINLEAIQDDIRGFAESSRVLMSLLDEVAKLHPVVAVAVLAFKAVVTLELKRRANDKKVIALHLQMQDMMSTLLQLRDIQQDRKGTDGRTVRDRLDTLMNDIARDIRNCGNVCDTYSKKHLLVKILKGPIYEGRLSDCATTFTDRQKDIRMALIIHTAVKIGSVTAAVADVHETVESTSEAVDTILLFRMLDSSDERELLKRVQANGGAKACMENDDILLELSKLREQLRERQLGRQCNTAPGELGGARTRRSRRTRARPVYATGYPIVGQGDAHYMTSAWPPPVTQLHPTYAPPQYAHDTAWNPGHTRPTPANGPYVGIPGERQPDEYDPLPDYPGGYDSTPLAQRLAEDTLNPLKTELNQDVDEGLEKNMVVFRRQLDVQTRQLEDIVIREGDRVIAAVTSGPHERILDPDLQTIWKEMDWKRSVNSREFVFALHEYFTEKYSSSDPLQAYISSTVPKSAREFRVAKQLANKKADNTRMLEYISMRHMQPILEAFDDDGSGFVSIREVNQLSSTRPANWSLPQWLSYWAVGWHYNTWDYKTKICGIIRTIYQERDNLLPVNRALVDVYLAHPTLDDLTTLMWSLQPFDTAIDDQFRQRATGYAQQEESRIERNLRLMAYEIDAASTLSLVTGPGRIERHLFPLLFLVMRHHLKIIRLAARVILNKEELITSVNTITQVLDYVQERATDLEGMLSKTFRAALSANAFAAIFDQQNTFGASIHPQFNRFAFKMVNCPAFPK